MQRVYLIPQLLEVVEAKEYQMTCLKCNHFVNRYIHLVESEEDSLHWN